jgi:uracil-DNA glycosylase family 4
MDQEPTDRAWREILRDLRAHLEWQRDCGGRWLPRKSAVVDAASAVPSPAAAERVRAASPATSAAGGAGVSEQLTSSAVHPAGSLDALREHIGDCRRCKLAGGRTHLVFGVGDANADLMFIGEGPGRDEDLQGEPFVGRAGQLLTEIITKGMKLRRGDVYIANVVKCRPPDNRNPEPDEIAACMPFLARQVELVSPRVIVALGTFAAQTLLGLRTPITRLRGTWRDYRGVKVMPTFHPAYLLRNPADKRLVWADIKLVMAELGLP